MIVVDASLALKWYLDEPYSDQAEAVLAAHTGAIVVPEILLTEVIGSFVRRANVNKLIRSESEASIRNFLALFQTSQIEVDHHSPVQAVDASKLALALGHPLKDCLYLELAMRLDIALFTFDRRFADKVRTIWQKIQIPA